MKSAIEYPVCRRHRRLSAIAGKFSARNLWNLGFGVLASFCGIYFLTQSYAYVFRGKPIEDPTAFYRCLAFAIFAIVTFVLARRFTPVKLLDVSEEGYRISIRNEEYARDFAAINAARIER